MGVHFGPDEVVLNLELFFHPARSVPEVTGAVDRLERRIQSAHPEMRYVFLGAEALSRSARLRGPEGVVMKPGSWTGPELVTAHCRSRSAPIE